jgi:hypothetical protein
LKSIEEVNSKALDKVRHRLHLDKMSTDVEPSRCQAFGQPFRPLCFIWFVIEISRIFRHVRVLFYADDMKLFLLVRGFRDCLKIQSDLNRLAEWGEANALELKVGKCKSILFSRLRHPIEFS